MESKKARAPRHPTDRNHHQHADDVADAAADGEADVKTSHGTNRLPGNSDGSSKQRRQRKAVETIPEDDTAGQVHDYTAHDK